MAPAIMQTPHSMLLAALSILAAAILYIRIKSYLRLRHIPGPFLASLTDLWSASKIWRGAHHHEIVHELHKRYGPVVRFGPNRVSFSSPDVIPQIYGIAQVFPKAPSYEPMKILANGKEVTTLLTVTDEKRVTGLKRHISAGFSQSTWLKQEGQIDGVLITLINQLRARAGHDDVPLNDWLSFWSFDTLTTLAFSESRGYLTAAKDLDNVFPGGRQRFAHWRLWASMPKLEALIYKNWFVTRVQRATQPLAQLAIRRIQQRKAEDKEGGGKDLLGRYLAASQEAPEAVAPSDVLALTVSTIHAGAETTAMTSSAALVYLLQNPETLKRLEEEVLDAGLSFPPEFVKVDKLVYLDSVIREAMRINVNPNCTERTITPPGADIGGVYLPAGTDVSISPKDTTRDPAVFGAESEKFKPERWLNVDKVKWAEMDRVSFGFSYGRRECIGKHLARMEMKKLLASLILNFKIVPTQPVKTWFEATLASSRLNVRLEPRVQS